MKTDQGAKEMEIEEVVGDFLKRTPFLPGGKKWKVNSFYFCLCFYFLIFNFFSLYYVDFYQNTKICCKRISDQFTISKGIQPFLTNFCLDIKKMCISKLSFD